MRFGRTFGAAALGGLLAEVAVLSLVFGGCSRQLPQSLGAISYVVQDNGGRVDWLESRGRLACDLLGDDLYYDLWTMDRDGGGRLCLSDINPSLPSGHHGNPAWHPSGEYIVFQCSDPSLAGRLAGTRGYLYYTTPGAGLHNNLWLITADGGSAWQLTSVGNNGGVLHPHFSHDGTRLAWAEMTATGPKPFGTWVMKTADFSFRDGAPVLANVTVLTPGDLQFYETHGFSPDDSTLIFTGMEAEGTPRDLDIFTCDTGGGSLLRLTDPGDKQWDEHAHYAPDGGSIIWMSTSGIDQSPEDIDSMKIKTDYWVMNSDGSGKRRVSFFNEKGSPQYIPDSVVAADLSVEGDGRHVIAYIKDSPTRAGPGSIVRIEVPFE